jgi:hypothetical protein
MLVGQLYVKLMYNCPRSMVDYGSKPMAKSHTHHTNTVLPVDVRIRYAI